MSQMQSTDAVVEQTHFYLFRFASLALTVGGIISILVQLIHPLEELTAVLTDRWFFVAILTAAGSLLVFLGLLGLYIRYLKYFEITGTIGLIFFEIFWLLSLIHSFIEAFILPLLVTTQPAFVEGLLNLNLFGESSYDFGAFAFIVRGSKVMYVLGAVLLGGGRLCH